MDLKKEIGSSSSVGSFSNAASRSERLVEVGEASESSDEGESEVFSAKPRNRSHARNASNLHGASSFDTASFSSVTPASPSITSVSQELPVRPIQCQSLLESNLALGKNLHEVAGLPYAVAIKEIDNVTLDLVRGQQLMDDVLRHLEQVGAGLQSIQHEADVLRAHCRSILPRAPTSAQGASYTKGASELSG